VTDRIRDLEDAHGSGAVGRRPVVIVRGEGARLWDATGRQYLDLGGAHGWAALGHSHPTVTRAVREQAGTLVMQTESSYSEQRALWMAELGAVLAEHFGTTARGPIARIHPCSSGTEANEAAIKLARLVTGRTEFVAVARGFHGRTLGSLSATADPKYRDPFAPLVPGFRHVPLNDIGGLEAAVHAGTAGVIVEIVQGEGGVRPAAPAFLAAARRACDAHGALLIVDEIQTGLGRTGRWFACEHTGLAPDVVTLGKPLGGGIPMGAAAWRSGLGTFAAGTHGSTFGGNPLACAAGRAVLRAIADERLPERAARLGALVLERLRAHSPSVVREVRGLGLMIGIELRQRVTPVLKALMAGGVWALPAGDSVLRLLPPLVIGEDELLDGTDAVLEALRGA
jgi:[amino-group carrier protein]-gamma-(L-lysyl/L-ornithyl)-L-glutamate aminotransferase